ncbi:uncharacterized protein LOC111446737 [Cucurbita moschata]|uniref:Uncharacterized protein LOC111446737 n=1 Tax=Cucurbita moschata TaxID=3662 RepID=A0A6J1FS45_CUCMO|nr:uncharacterized protein LOC111446737 [Cucurbita moschata]
MLNPKPFAGGNVFVSCNLVAQEIFDALKQNGADVFICCDPSRNGRKFRGSLREGVQFFSPSPGTWCSYRIAIYCYRIEFLLLGGSSVRAFMCKRVQTASSTGFYLLPCYGWCENSGIRFSGG